MITLALCAVAVLSVAGMVALVHALRNAPEGHENDVGFFQGRPSEPAEHVRGGDQAA